MIAAWLPLRDFQIGGNLGDNFARKQDVDEPNGSNFDIYEWIITNPIYVSHECIDPGECFDCGDWPNMTPTGQPIEGAGSVDGGGKGKGKGKGLEEVIIFVKCSVFVCGNSYIILEDKCVLKRKIPFFLLYKKNYMRILNLIVTSNLY